MKKRSTMVNRVKAYLEHRRALGFALDVSGELLMQFARFVDRSGHRGPLTTDLVLRWVALPETASPRYRATRLSIIRSFARYLAAQDGRSEVPDRRLLGKNYYRMQPHIYSDRQVQELILAATKLSSTYPLRPLTYSTLFGLLASTGLRISEALKLKKDHVDLVQKVMRIEQTKFHKSRLVPFHPTVAQALRRYICERDRNPSGRTADAFFIGGHGLALPYPTVQYTFRRLRIRLGWRSNGMLPNPRIQDLRHTFACTRLLRWYQQGVDIDHAIAALSTYLGHGKVTDTYWYLTGTPQLLSIAGERFEQYVGRCGGDDHDKD